MYPYPTPDDNNDYEGWSELADEYMKSSSGTDGTGLIPAAVQSDSELENYNELYDFLPTAVSDRRYSDC